MNREEWRAAPGEESRERTLRGQDRGPAKRDRPLVRPALIEDADGCAFAKTNTWNEDRRPGRSDHEATSAGIETRFSSTGQFDAAHPRARRPPLSAISGVCRGRSHKIDDAPADVLVMRTQPRRPASMPLIIFGGAMASDLAITQSRTTCAIGLRREAGLRHSQSNTTEALTRSRDALRAQPSGTSGHFWAPCRTRKTRIARSVTI